MSATIERGRSLQESVSCPASARSTRFPKPFLMVSSVRGRASPFGLRGGGGRGRNQVVRPLTTSPREERAGVELAKQGGWGGEKNTYGNRDIAINTRRWRHHLRTSRLGQLTSRGSISLTEHNSCRQQQKLATNLYMTIHVKRIYFGTHHSQRAAERRGDD